MVQQMSSLLLLLKNKSMEKCCNAGSSGTVAALRRPNPPEMHQMTFRTLSSAASQASRIPGFLAARSRAND